MCCGGAKQWLKINFNTVWWIGRSTYICTPFPDTFSGTEGEQTQTSPATAGALETFFDVLSILRKVNVPVEFVRFRTGRLNRARSNKLTMESLILAQDER
jgi:hypothetical protein